MKHFILCLYLMAATSQAFAQAPSAVLEEAAARSPAVAAVLDAPRETPGDALAAASILLNLREYAVAGEVLRPVLEANLPPAELAGLVRRYGTAEFLKFARVAEDHQVAGLRQFAESALAAAATEAARPERLTELIADLSSDDAVVRAAARNDLAATGLPAAQAVLEALATSTDRTQRANLLAGLVEMSPVVDPLVIAALADGEGQFRRDVAELAGHLHLLEAVPWLATIAAGAAGDAEVVATAQAALARMGLPLPDVADALATVKRELERVDAGIPTYSLPNELGLWWSLDPVTNKFTSVELIACERRSLIHARLAANMLVLPNASAADRQLAIISAVEASHILGVPPSPEIARLAESLPTRGLNEALATAMETNRINAAIVCADLLGQRADPAALVSLGGGSTPLAAAVAHPNRQLKFTALAAIMRISPTSSFPGASYVADALWQIAAGAGTPQAVVGSSTVARAGDWAGHLRGLGYDAMPVATGVELIRQALELPRVELILVDSDIGRPLVREVVYQLRTHPKLRQTPIAVLRSNRDAQLGQQLATADSYVLSVPRPRSAEATQSVVDRLMQLAPSQLTVEERTAQAVQAVEWIGTLLVEGSPYDELRRDAGRLEQLVYHPELTEASLKALSGAGTASSQRTLVDFASQPSQPMPLRQLATASFATSRDRFGVLLSAAEIARQYDRYNASETSSADVQQLLGQILDILEKNGN